MQLPVLLFALAAFLLGSVLADVRPVPVGVGCATTPQASARCACSATGGCPTSAQMFFACQNTGTKIINDIGIRFEAGYSQPSQSSTWQVANTQGGWGSLSVDLFTPSSALGSSPSAPGPSPVPYNPVLADQWYTAGVTPLRAGVTGAAGPSMWVCTRNQLMQLNSNNGFGPAQPRCVNQATGAVTAVYSAGCQEALLFDYPTPPPASVSYLGWAYSGIRVTSVDGSTSDTSGRAKIPVTPLAATNDLRPFPGGAGNYNLGGVNMKCYYALYSPCATACPSGQACAQANTDGSCKANQCCPYSSIVKPTDGSSWFCCPSGQVYIEYSSVSQCCPSNETYFIDKDGHCCPKRKMSNPQGNGGTCCPDSQFEASTSTCCASTLVNGQCCPDGPAPPASYSSTPIPSNQNFYGTRSYCCPTAQLNDQLATPANLACCPTSTSGRTYTTINLSSGNRFCCPAANSLSGTGNGVPTGEKVCCPGDATSTTYTTKQGSTTSSGITSTAAQCCPNARLAVASGSCLGSTDPICCDAAGGAGNSQCIAADNRPCCPNANVGSVVDTSGATAAHCCPNNAAGAANLVWFAPGACCLKSYVVSVPAPASGSGDLNGKICCPNGIGATAAPSITFLPSCTAASYTGTCQWNQASACCADTNVHYVGSNGNTPTTRYCCAGTVAFNCNTDGATGPNCPLDVASGKKNPCCPASSVITTCADSSKYCCPAGAGSCVSNNKCCPSGNRPQMGNSATLADYCCTDNRARVYINATIPCCLLSNIPLQAGSTTVKNFDQCCTNAGSSPVWVNGYGCCESRYVVDLGNGNYRCCDDIANPVITDGNVCCDGSRDINTYCCPAQNGRNVAVGAQCPSNNVPAAPATCWVTNANCALIGGPATGCCCYGGATAQKATNGPALPPLPVCCNANTPSTNYFYTTENSCCTDYTPNYRASIGATGGDVAKCCATNGRPLGSTAGSGANSISCNFYTALIDVSGNNQPCCRNCDANRNFNNPATLVTTADARCCGAGVGSNVPVLTDGNEAGLQTSSRYCCPLSRVLNYGGQTYCCINAVSAGTTFIDSTCCPAGRGVTNPNGNVAECCPSDVVGSSVVWSNLGAGSSCCPANAILRFSAGVIAPVTVTPNVPASSFTGAPDRTSANVFCCPNFLSSASPLAVDAYLPAFVPISNGQGQGVAPENVNYNQLTCCAAANVIKVQSGSAGKVYDICCPSPNMVWNSQTKSCCAGDIFTPPCPNPAPLTGCPGTCCPAGTSGALVVTVNGYLPTSGTTTFCCNPPAPPSALYTGSTANQGNIVSYNGKDYCCPPPLNGKTPTPAYRPTDGSFAPCCAAADTLDCNVAACNITARPYKLCCPAAGYSQVANSGNAPIIVDPATGLCCKGYLNSPGLSSAWPGNNKCCTPLAGYPSRALYREASDNPCCVTLIDPTDFSCCPANRYHSGTPPACCKASEAWASVDGKCCPIALATGLQADGTYTKCCEDPTFTNDPGHTCCLTSTLQNGYCCPPEQLDSTGVCCPNSSLPLTQFIDTSSGEAVIVNGTASNLSACCLSGLFDCAGFCYFLDFDGVVKAFHVNGSKPGQCCPEDELDCAGECPNADGSVRNTGVIGDCCPKVQRGCANGVPNTGICGSADTNCCEQYTGTNCTACTDAPGCGWCNQIGSSVGLCLSGDYFAPTPGVEGRVCNATAGFRWTAAGTSKVFLETNGFNDGRNIEWANVSVLLTDGVELVVNFTIRAPADLPLDVYFLQDRTNSFIQPVIVGSTYIQYGPLDVLKGNLDELDLQVSALVPSGYHLGFGTFGDKSVEPFGYWKNSGFYDYVYTNEAAINQNRASVITAIKNLDPLTFAGGYDIPESSLEALLHVAQNPIVSWGTTRPDLNNRQVPVNKIVVLVTDAPAHSASTDWPNGGYAPDTAFPTQPFAPNLPTKDLGYYLSSDPTASALGPALQSPGWRSSTGSYTDTMNCPSPFFRQPDTAFDGTRQGICYDYPSKAQVASAINTRGFTVVYAVADTVSSQYTASAGRDFWQAFSTNEMPAAGPTATSGVVVALNYSADPNAPGGLVYEIVAAIKRITQNIEFSNTTTSPFLVGAVNSTFNLPPSKTFTVGVPLKWDASTYTAGDPTGPFPIDFAAIFPLSGYTIDVARINVYISPKRECCFCGDGKLDNETGCDEECDNDNSTDSTCCKSCKLQVGAICANDVLCYPVICTDVGKCENVDLNQLCTNNLEDPLAFCQFNSCLAGACVVQCNSDACCNDDDNCTDDVCVLDLSLCSYTLKDECDCSNSAYNNCFDCVRNNNTNCAYETNSGSCFQYNETIFEQGGYGPGINPVAPGDEKGIQKFCVVSRGPNGKTGIIVGSVVGALAALGLIALAAALWWRLKNGPLLAPGGAAANAGPASGAETNPIYASAPTQANPLHEAGGQA